MATPVISATSSAFLPVGSSPPESVTFGKSKVMLAVREKIHKVAGTNVPVLIQGETGTGKELVANLIHSLSPWKDSAFVKVNCPAIPGTLIESELFGYEKGAFTGAYGSKPGRVELAHGGTLFLDEISELDPELQAKLLMLLQDGEFCRIGAQENRRVEVRVLCATNRQLAQEIETGSFRQDLFYRISVVNINVPPLRERVVDIPELAAYFLELYNKEYNCQAPPFSSQVLKLLQQYHWPGNIRQLQNMVKRYVILDSEEAVTSELVSQGPTRFDLKISAGEVLPLKELTRQAIEELERKVILQVLQANHWNRKKTARALQISYRALLYKIRNAGLPSRNNRSTVPPSQDTDVADDYRYPLEASEFAPTGGRKPTRFAGPPFTQAN